MTQQEFANLLRGDQIDAINRLNLAPTGQPVARSKHYNAKAPGAKLDERFATWSDFLGATWAGAKGQGALTAQDEIARMQNAFGSTIRRRAGSSSRRRCGRDAARWRWRGPRATPGPVVPMESLRVPFPMHRLHQQRVGSVYGGIVGYWTEEGGQPHRSLRRSSAGSCSTRRS